MSIKGLRRQLFVDPKIQGALIGRAVMYWAFCLLSIALMLLCWRLVIVPGRDFFSYYSHLQLHYGLPLVASFILLPLVILDVIRLSNRFVGPMLRLRRAMRGLAQGEHVDPIRFRDGDFWKEFADEFNAVAARVQGETPSIPTTEPPADKKPAPAPQAERDEQEEPVLAGMD